MAGFYKVLAIDGGGIRGVIPAVLLTEMEKRIGKPIGTMFDLIAGTSTGGILAAGLAAPGDGGGPKHNAASLLKLYQEHGRKIFARSFWKGVTSLGGVSDEKYDAANLEGVLDLYLGDAEVKDALCELVITSYDIEKRSPYFFKRCRARDTALRNHRLADVARATSAAPTYFEPAATRTADGSVTRYLIDGGVFANNPALCAYAEACGLKKRTQEIFMVSLGTGIATRAIPYDDAKDWGLMGWVRPIISVMMDGVSDTVDYQMAQMLPPALPPDEDAAPAGKAARYYRFDIPLEEALDDLDAAHRANIEALTREAERILRDDRMGPAFDQLCDFLKTH